MSKELAIDLTKFFTRQELKDLHFACTAAIGRREGIGFENTQRLKVCMHQLDHIIWTESYWPNPDEIEDFQNRRKFMEESKRRKTRKTQKMSEGPDFVV